MSDETTPLQKVVNALDQAVTWLDDASALAKEAGLTKEYEKIEAIWSDAETLHSELKEEAS